MNYVQPLNATLKDAEIVRSAGRLLTMDGTTNTLETTDVTNICIGVAVEEVMKAKVNEAEKKASSPNSLARSANYISDHLQNMEDLKEGVVFLKYMGRDIVAEYQSEAFKMFKGLEDKMRFNAIYSLWQSL